MYQEKVTYFISYAFFICACKTSTALDLFLIYIKLKAKFILNALIAHLPLNLITPIAHTSVFRGELEKCFAIIDLNLEMIDHTGVSNGHCDKSLLKYQDFHMNFKSKF